MFIRLFYGVIQTFHSFGVSARSRQHEVLRCAVMCYLFPQMTAWQVTICVDKDSPQHWGTLCFLCNMCLPTEYNF